MIPDRLLTLGEVVQRRAEMQPHDAAYTFLSDGETEGRTVTYSELGHEIQSLAMTLRHWRIRRPLLVYPPGLDFIISFFACIYAGITPIPAGLAHVTRIGRSLARLGAVASDADADAVLSVGRVIDRTLADSDFAVRSPRLSAMRWLATDCIDNTSTEFCEFIGAPLDAPAFIQYTSGSTSTPKGVIVTHRNLLHNLNYCSDVEENDEETVSVSWLPHSHDMGLIEAILLPMFGGYRAYLMSPASFLRRPARWLEAITRFRATNSGGPNFAYDLCVEKISAVEQEALNLSTWRVAYNGSETIRKDTLLRFRHRFESSGFRWNAFYPVYGLAESTLLVASGQAADVPVFRDIDADSLKRGLVEVPQTQSAKTATVVSSGRPASHTRIVIANPDTRVQCGPNEIGEIWISSPSVATGYWRRVNETEAAFHAYLRGTEDGPFLRTGDLGFLDEGHLFITGRIKDVINIRGFKHYPQDIEHTVRQSHTTLCTNSCAAFAVERDGVEQLAVVVEITPKLSQRFEDWAERAIIAIQHAVTEHHGVQIQSLALAPFGSIPKTTSGKLQRQLCRSQFIEGSLQTMQIWSLGDFRA
jgi:acyl-CoA synthetase (AMP-forming)/AMP-acid ligase II